MNNRSNAGGNNFSNRSYNNNRILNNNMRSSNNNMRSSNNNMRSSNNNMRSSNNNMRSSNNKSSNNTVKKKGVSKPSSSTVFIIIAVILLVIILAVGGYFLYKHLNEKKIGAPTTKQFISYIHDASIEKTISNGSIPQSANGNEYNINFWIYVNDYSHRKDEDKCILFKGGPSSTAISDSKSKDVTNSNPSVWLLSGVNTLRVVVGIETNYKSAGCSTAGASKPALHAHDHSHDKPHEHNAGSSPTEDCTQPVKNKDVCDIEHFPLQRWVNVNITLHDNVIDVFFDGKLKKSTILKGFPITTTGSMFICPNNGFNGYISNLKYSNSAVNVSTIVKMYKNGPTL